MAIGYGRRLAARSAVRLTLAVASCLTCARADQATQDTVVGAVGCVPGPFTPPQFCIASSVNYAWVDVTDCGSYTGGQVAVSPPSADSLCCFATEESCGMVSQGLNAAHSTPCSSGEYMVGAATSGSLLTCNPANCLAGSQYCVDVAPVRAYSNHTGFVFTGSGICADLMMCTSTQYQTVAPRCAATQDVIALLNGTFVPPSWNVQAALPNSVTCDDPDHALWPSSGTAAYISNRHCANITACSESQFVNTWPTATTDAACRAIRGPCGDDETQAISPVPGQTDRVCTATSSGKLSAGDDVGITLGVLLALVVAGVIGAYRLRKANKRHEIDTMAMELQERLLVDEVQRMRKGWQISEEQVTWLTKIAQGAFGTVWKGKWGHMEVAIKRLHAGIAELEPEAVAEFQREASRMQAIRHPNLVTFFGAGTDASGEPFLVFEMMHLGSLKGLLGSNRELDWATRRQFAVEIAQGMEHLHRIPIIHRDLKSDNVLIGDDLHAKVADFGQSRLLGTGPGRVPSFSRDPRRMSTATTKSASSTVATSNFGASLTSAVGTPLYAAPELLAEATDYGPAIDVYSFGVIMWELLTRQTPWSNIEARNHFEFQRKLESAVFGGVRPTIPADAPAGYAALLRESWATEPSSRPAFAAIIMRLQAD